MHEVIVTENQKVVVLRRDLLFRFELCPADDGKVHIDFFVPARDDDDDDGALLPVDEIRRETVELGEVHETGYEAVEDGEPIEGDVDIEVISREGGRYRVHVTVPDDCHVALEDADQ